MRVCAHGKESPTLNSVLPGEQFQFMSIQKNVDNLVLVQCCRRRETTELKLIGLHSLAFQVIQLGSPRNM